MNFAVRFGAELSGSAVQAPRGRGAAAATAQRSALNPNYATRTPKVEAQP